MLSTQENAELTQVGPGTPMGDLMRRYWHPIAATAELDERPTKAVRLMGEDLVLYRDKSGTLGLIERACPAPPRRSLLRHTGGARSALHVPRLDDGRDRPVHRAALRGDRPPGRTLQGEGEDRGLPRAGDGGARFRLHGPAAHSPAAALGTPAVGQRRPRHRDHDDPLQLAAVPGEFARPGSRRMASRVHGRVPQHGSHRRFPTGFIPEAHEYRVRRVRVRHHQAPPAVREGRNR